LFESIDYATATTVTTASSLLLIRSPATYLKYGLKAVLLLPKQEKNLPNFPLKNSRRFLTQSI